MARYKKKDDGFTQQHPSGGNGTSLGAIFVVMLLVGGAGAGTYYFQQKTEQKQKALQEAHQAAIERLEADAQNQITAAMKMAREEAEAAMADKIKQLEGQLDDFEAAMPMFEDYRKEALEARSQNEELQKHFDGLSAQITSLEAELVEAEKKAKAAANSGALTAVKQREDALIDQLKKSQLRIRDQKETMRRQAARIQQLEEALQNAQGSAPAN